MGAVVSCITSIFHAIGACLMGIVNTIGAVCKAIIDGVVTLFDVIISCLTCGSCDMPDLDQDLDLIAMKL
ncbi:hypothetical protein CBS63078_1072 [Aspergillus niger]|uniref:Uncharacterized protein n=1 Tax=Aspergillus niger TaxID=5061 RepID=A0A505HUV3_ASPNG|nr:hypothetical protein CBS115989_4461 [Aspergillus niger]KAI2832216.1 hypothetical protein CBS133816_1700 [Aspergillus niger]KAI2843423.1 hypothetical protein CBS11350_5292 [Aspergillus niger]KAI2855219.1 hypothetical protein CBS11232_4539 [Aspergillus niger]KAI2867108.1 hypothetical protein CBS12448_546 [Aspergillus niger]